MPALDVERAKAVFFVKRSMAPGYAGIDNTLFCKGDVMMPFGDAERMTEEIDRGMRDPQVVGPGPSGPDSSAARSQFAASAATS
jgi:hypothetical protein